MDDFERKYGISAAEYLSMPRDKQVDVAARVSVGLPPKAAPKKASVVKRGILGGIVAGPAGAVVGALSAVDKNNKDK